MKGGADRPIEQLVLQPTFFKNYETKIKNIKPSSCWKYESSITKQNCDMAPFFNGLKSTSDYVKKNFRYDESTRLVHISESESISIDQIPHLPEEGCRQVVLGTFELIAVYFYYNEVYQTDKFILLAAENWTEKLNQEYVSCAFNLLLHNQPCQYPIRLLLPKNPITFLRANKSPRATLFELCIILQQSNRFNVYQYLMDNQSYDLYFMKHISGKGGRRSRTTRKKRNTRKAH
jgi:hypothetical protein